MKFDARIAIPAALTALAFALPAGASATPPQTFQCPDGFVLMPNTASPTADKNGDGFVCMKVTPGTEPIHDDNCNCDHLPFSTNPDDYVDDIPLV
jgi:hypothetical protein